jgi:glycosyltransferase involved in cell wall biosynthesis
MIKRRLKIAIFHLAFIYSGGGEKLVLEEAKGLVKRGHQVTIFSPVVDRKNCFPEIIGQFKIKTLPNLPSVIPQWEVFQVLLACALAPFLALRFKKFDIILAANQPSLWLAFWVKVFFKIPYFAYLAQPTRVLHQRKIDRETGLMFAKKWEFLPATYLMKMFKPLANWVDRTSVKGANLVLANGEHARKVLEKTYKVKVISCPAGAYPAAKISSYKGRFHGELEVERRTIFKPYILLTNRHFPQKRFEYAITALPAILKKIPNLSLIITGGETDYTQDLKNLVKQLSLEKKVIFLGLVKEKDLDKLYSRAVVYVYTAPEEDFGMGMVEAMAYGVPVVAWKSGGPMGIVVNGKTGFLAKPFDVVDFTDKIAQLLGDKRLGKQMGRNGLERVRKEFSWEKHLECLEKEAGRIVLSEKNSKKGILEL